MNFLAHSLFGFNNTELTAGQFCGDFVRGSNLSHLPTGIERGIRLHRHLDQFTDSHEALTPVRQGIPGVRRRFGGIVIDVMFDHYLARRWEQISPVSLAAHAQSVHNALSEHVEHFPDGLRRFMQILKSEHILQNNIHLESIELTLTRIAGRSTQLESLSLTQAQLEPLRERLTEPFNAFYPDLQDAAHAYLSALEGV